MLGIIAACLTTVAFVPQVLKVIRTKETQALSLGMCALQATGVFMWFVYGVSIQDSALIGANAITFVLSFTVLFYKLRYK